MLSQAMVAVSEAAGKLDLGTIQGDIPRAWIQEALAATGIVTARKRRLPAEQVPWMVVGMSLFGDLAIEAIVDRMQLALADRSGKPVSKSAIVGARERVGPAPIQWLFCETANTWAHASARSDAWRGLSLYAVDGTTLQVPEAVRETYGGRAGPGESTSAFPSVRLVALMAVRSHLLAGARFGRFEMHEQTLAWDLWSDVPDDSLTLVDRGYIGAPVFCRLTQEGNNRHWLTRAMSKMRWKEVERFGEGDMLVEIAVPLVTRRAHPEIPESYRARVIDYRHGDSPGQRLLTSLLDPVAYPANELIELYHERWEIELGYDELKTHQISNRAVLRSRTPAGIEQEIWGLLLAYNLVRFQMERIAETLGVPPTRISFVGSLLLIQNWLWTRAAFYSPGKARRHLDDLHAKAKRLLLPNRRDRTNPRGIRGYPSRYPSLRRSRKGGAAK
jgi:hypothetical protein